MRPFPLLARASFILAIPGTVAAQSIPVVNAGFEEPAMNPGAFTLGAVPGWDMVPGSGSGSWGVFYPTVPMWGYVAPHGNQVLYTNGPAIEQTLTTPAAADTTYALLIDVINRPGFGGRPYFIELYAGSTLLARDDNTLLPPSGGFLVSVLSATVASGSPAVGQPLRIRLGGMSQTNFDNVRLTTAYCYANCDDSTGLPLLNVNDFICFQARFAAGNPWANCDGSTAPPILNINDLICFQSRFATGCP